MKPDKKRLPYRRLAVWQRGRLLLPKLYRLTRAFPVEEKFGITAQMRRAAVSIVCDIAEGSKKITDKEYAYYLNRAEGSATEVTVPLEISGELELAGVEECLELALEFNEVERMLYGLRRTINA